ncbi:DJ-1/PfpI family protein [Alteromonas sp. ASW11-19]|uniref:DJ-1/PfpI family protein n=1 Tax=Alteromonas salexigens TaxID=2982530 RepID=A0ABT2VKG9_9ALTE|nr:DJ-1/PfpI family protein [Alteromonas salexigens]MCU7553292.1 DJ-1/PfpI family protein [Alteromonas salexigens]
MKTTTQYWLRRLTVCTMLMMTTGVAAKPPITVAILLFDDVQIIDFAAPYEVFGHAGYDIFTVSPDGQPVVTAMGLHVSPDYGFADMPAAEAVLIPGGDVRKVKQQSAVKQWLARMQTGAEHIVSVCTGAHILAEAGLLNGQRATTFKGALDNFATDYPNVTLAPHERFVDNGQIITSAGLSSGIDAALHLVQKVSGLATARTVALHIEYDWDPDGGFVRALMADRYYPDNQYDWPQPIAFDREYSYGDKTTWTKAFHVKSPAAATALLASYRKAMAVHEDWQAVTTEAEDQLRWHSVRDGNTVRHDVTVTRAGQAGQYRLTLDIAVVSATSGDASS